MTEPSQDKEQLRETIRRISSRPPPKNPEQSGNYNFDMKLTNQEIKVSIIPTIFFGIIAIALMGLLLAVRFNWI